VYPPDLRFIKCDLFGTRMKPYQDNPSAIRSSVIILQSRPCRGTLLHPSISCQFMRAELGDIGLMT
jgi:hypothetical protein